MKAQLKRHRNGTFTLTMCDAKGTLVASKKFFTYDAYITWMSDVLGRVPRL